MTAATDKNESKVVLDLGSITADAVIAAKNAYAQILVAWNAAPAGTPGKHKAFWFSGQTIPNNTDYPDTIAPIGSKYTRFGLNGNAVVTVAEEYLKSAAGVWQRNEQVHYADLVISSAQLLALNATPIVIVPAAPATSFHMPVAVQYYTPGGTAYVLDAADDLAIRYTNGSGTILITTETTGFLDQTIAHARFQYAPSTAAVNPTTAAALVVHMANSEVTTGNYALYVRLFYKTINAILPVTSSP